jgi:hypothetical protein
MYRIKKLQGQRATLAEITTAPSEAGQREQAHYLSFASNFEPEVSVTDNCGVRAQLGFQICMVSSSLHPLPHAF